MVTSHNTLPASSSARRFGFANHVGRLGHSGRFSFLDLWGLGMVALMLSLPFLIATHTAPIAAFHGEWLAAALGLAASMALISAPRLHLPGAAGLALVLALAIALQTALNIRPVPQLSTLFALYLVWAALLACIGKHLAQTFGLAGLVRVAATALLVGAVLAAIASLLSPWLPAVGWTVFAPQQGGPVGQSNHFTTYLWIGVASALYLHSIEVLSPRKFWVSSLLLVLTSVWVGQRSSFLYVGILIGVTVWQARGSAFGGVAGAVSGTASGAALQARRSMLYIGLLFVLFQPLPVLLPPIYDSSLASAPGLRLIREIQGPSVRLQLVGVAWEGIKAAPWLGNGVGSYPSLALAHANDIAPSANPGPSEHAHNVLVDMAVELGLPAALLLVFAAGLWFWRLPRRTAPKQATWAMAVVGILIGHSCIEYPLWYCEILGLLALVAGAFGTAYPVGRRLTAVALVLGLVGVGGWNLHALRNDYTKLETAMALGKTAATMPQAQAALLGVPPQSLLAPWVYAIACVSLDPLQVPLQDGLVVCSLGVNFAPTTVKVVHLAVLQWRNGQVEAAQRLLQQLQKASSRNPKEIDALFAALQAREPGLAALGSRQGWKTQMP